MVRALALTRVPQPQLQDSTDSTLTLPCWFPGAPDVRLVAPYEADAQLAFLARNAMIDVVLSEDSDNLPYAALPLMSPICAVLHILSHCNCTVTAPPPPPPKERRTAPALSIGR